jgi:murein DD-endopeptidase MepM/ murein hydrolase activator NlpD
LLTPVVAPGGGILTIGTSERAGLFALLDLENGATVSFSHLSSALLPAGSKPGDRVRVKAGDVIGFTGESGNARGSGRDPHVHIVTRVKGVLCSPRDFFSKDGGGQSCGK